MPFGPLLMEDQNLYDVNNFVSPWMLTKADLNPVRPPMAPRDQAFDAFGPEEDDPNQEDPPLQLQGQMQQPPPMQNIDLTPSLPRFSGDPQMAPPQFDLGSPSPDANGEMYLPPVSAGPEVGSVTSFDAPRPFSEGFVGAPKAGSTGWDTLGRGVSDALGGAAYNVLTLGGADSVRTSPNLLMQPGQLSSSQLHPPVPAQPLDRAFPLSNPQAGQEMSPTSDYTLGAEEMGEVGPDNETNEGAPAVAASAPDALMGGSMVLGDEDNNPNDADDRPPMAYRNTGDNGVPTFGVSDYVTGSTGAPALDGLNDSDLAKFVAENGGVTNRIEIGSDIPTPPKGMQYSALEPITDKAGVPLGGFNAKFGPEDTSAADAIHLQDQRLRGQLAVEDKRGMYGIGEKVLGLFNRNGNSAAMAGVEQRTAESLLKDIRAREESVANDVMMDPATKAQKQAELDAERAEVKQSMRGQGAGSPSPSVTLTASQGVALQQAVAAAKASNDPRFKGKTDKEIAKLILSGG